MNKRTETKDEFDEMYEAFQQFIKETAKDYNRIKYKEAYSYREEEWEVFQWAWKKSRSRR